MVAGGEQSGYGILTVREQLWMFSQFYGLPPQGGLAPRRRAHRRRGHGPRARAAGQHAEHRPAPEDELRARPAQRPVDPVPRRADPRPRRRRGPPGPRAGRRLEGGRPRPDGPADDPLHGRGRRAVRAHRHRRPRSDPGHRHARGAQEARPARVDLPARARPARRRPGDAGPAARRRVGQGRRGRDAARSTARPWPSTSSSRTTARSAAWSARWPAWARTSSPCRSRSPASRTSSSSSSGAASTRTSPTHEAPPGPPTDPDRIPDDRATVDAEEAAEVA